MEHISEEKSLDKKTLQIGTISWLVLLMVLSIISEHPERFLQNWIPQIEALYLFASVYGINLTFSEIYDALSLSILEKIHTLSTRDIIS